MCKLILNLGRLWTGKEEIQVGRCWKEVEGLLFVLVNQGAKDGAKTVCWYGQFCWLLVLLATVLVIKLAKTGAIIRVVLLKLGKARALSHASCLWC